MNTESKHEKMKKERQRRKMFLNLGLIVAISATLVAFEWNFDMQKFKEVKVPDIETDIFMAMPPLPPDVIEVPKPDKPVQQPPNLNAEINEVDNKEEVEVVDSSEFVIADTIPETFTVLEDIKQEVDTMDITEGMVDYEAHPLIGFAAFYSSVAQYVSTNLRSIDKRMMYGTTKVYVTFVVEPDGTLSHADVVRGKGVNGYVNNLVRTAVLEASEWEPSQIKGKKIRHRIIVPISFKVSN